MLQVGPRPPPGPPPPPSSGGSQWGLTPSPPTKSFPTKSS